MWFGYVRRIIEKFTEWSKIRYPPINPFLRRLNKPCPIQPKLQASSPPKSPMEMEYIPFSGDISILDAEAGPGVAAYHDIFRNRSCR